MSLSDTDTTIVADLANAGQRITTLTSNLMSLQALMGNVATTQLAQRAVALLISLSCRSGRGSPREGEEAPPAANTAI